MTHPPVSWLPLAIAAALAGLAYWLNQLASQPLPADDAAFRHEPDLIVENFVATAFDRHGNARHVLAAQRMLYYPDDETTALAGPRFELFSPHAPPLRAEAARGFVSTHGEHVYLLDQVRLARAATPGNPELVLTTEYLQITPEAQRMQTHRPVEVRQGASSVRADRMLLDGGTRSLELKGNVRGMYAKG